MSACVGCYFLVCVLLLLMFLDNSCTGSTCPLPCICKWKGGKQTVECKDRALITLPEGVDSETQVLDVSGNNLQIIPRETFLRAGLINLQRIFLRNCRIGQIDDRAFKGLTNLIELDLSHNLLTAVPSGTFQDIPFLRDLLLANNPIQKIDSQAFRAVPALLKLDLSNCDLQTIAPNAFEGIELLESLKLNGNKLTELRPRTVETLRRLHGMELHDNPWHCDCRLRPVKEWLTEYNIPLRIAPVCSGGPERIIHRTFSDLHIDDFACKPEILPVNRYIEINTGDNITIVCRASAIPPPHINWYWNGRLLVNNSAFSSHQKIVVLEDGNFDKRSTLIITNAQESNSNEFYCVAENRAGNTEANFTVRVTLRAASMVTFGSGQIAGLSAALVILILFILFVVLMLLLRIRRQPFIESKTPSNVEIVTVVNNSTISNGKATVSSNANASDTMSDGRKVPSDLNFCNPIQKPPRLTDFSYIPNQYAANGNVNPGSCFVSPSSGSGNNPDLINDTKLLENGVEVGVSASDDTATYEVEPVERPGSGEYSRNPDSLYPSGLWSHPSNVVGDSCGKPNLGFSYDDRTSIIGEKVNVRGYDEDIDFHQNTPLANYPSDYGLPILETKVDTVITSANNVNLPTNAKTLRVWQKGGVPVLPPVTAIKRALTHNRNSPDEGYQEGCGTDV